MATGIAGVSHLLRHPVTAASRTTRWARRRSSTSRWKSPGPSFRSSAFMGMFAWGAKLYFDIERPPDNAHSRLCRRQTVDVEAATSRRPARDQRTSCSRRSAGEAHHDFAGRDPQLLRPRISHQAGRAARPLHQHLVSRPRKPGKYHLFCAEYCGTKHCGMIGWIYAMEPHDYQAWLTQGGAEGSLASQGREVLSPVRLRQLPPLRQLRAAARICATCTTARCELSDGRDGHSPMTPISANPSSTPAPRSSTDSSPSCRPSRAN